jgi:hypothetical protein
MPLETFEVLQAWFAHPHVCRHKADPALLAAALECWCNQAVVVEQDIDLPSVRGFRNGQLAMLERVRVLVAEIRMDDYNSSGSDVSTLLPTAEPCDSDHSIEVEPQLIGSDHAN